MEISKKELFAIEKICETLELGEIFNIKYIDSSQNKVYRIDTHIKSYILKQYSPDAIKNEYDLNKRKRQISVSEILYKNGVPTITPLKFRNKCFISYRKVYYLLYEYSDYETINAEDLNTKKIKKLANTLAIIHKLNIKSDLPCLYKKVNIDLPKYVKKFAKTDEKLHKTLEDNLETLQILIENCNSSIKEVKDNLCISHNDYKLKNILWQKDFMYLIDFDACGISNPVVSLAESAFNFAKQGKDINEDFYKEFINTYTKKFGRLYTDYEIALKVAMNGKLQWFEYQLSKCTKSNQEIIKETISMINELVLYSKNQEKFYNIFKSVVK